MHAFCTSMEVYMELWRLHQVTWSDARQHGELLRLEVSPT